MFLEKPLQLAVRITSGPDQVLFGIRQLVLFESRFGFGELDPNLQVVSFTPLGKRALRGQLLDLFLVRLDLRFNRLDSLLDGPGLLGLGVRLLASCASRSSSSVTARPDSFWAVSNVRLSIPGARSADGVRLPPRAASESDELRVRIRPAIAAPTSITSPARINFSEAFITISAHFIFASAHSKRRGRTTSSKPSATRPRIAIGAAAGATTQGNTPRCQIELRNLPPRRNWFICHATVISPVRQSRNQKK
ncbi:MAG: hypothetical protein DMG08_29820 [Acidobacteria bacterium]|nr:MAG: hypothetical protein DMG08_29820 [Acidobacteriota bacterium]